MAWLFVFFFISGFCSILYELIWLRLAMADCGGTPAMVSTVLSMFMAGLGLGSWAGGRLARRWHGGFPALRLYALTESAHRHLGGGGPLRAGLGARPAAWAGVLVVVRILPVFRRVGGGVAGALVRMHGGDNPLRHAGDPLQLPAGSAALVQLPVPGERSGRDHRGDVAAAADRDIRIPWHTEDWCC